MEMVAIALAAVDAIGWRYLVLLGLVAIGFHSVVKAIRLVGDGMLEEIKLLRSDVRHSGGLSFDDSATLQSVEDRLEQIECAIRDVADHEESDP